MKKAYSKDEYDILLDVSKNFKKHRRKIKRVQKAIIEKRQVGLDSPERIKAYINRENQRKKVKAVINNNFDPLPPVIMPEDFDELESMGPPETAIIDDIDVVDINDDITLERLIGSSNDLLSVETLEAGLEAAKSVGLVRMEPFGRGTGFLVGPKIMLTNWHNIPDIETARKSKFILDFEENDFGARKQAEEYKLDPDLFYISDAAHDFALVGVKSKSRLGKDISHYGAHRLFEEEGKIVVGHPVNVIQHPEGERKKITLHNSNLVNLSNETEEDQFCYYSADTLKGSSGSPIYNKHWEVIALHRKGVPETEGDEIVLKDGRKIARDQMKLHDKDIKWIGNQGVRISRIIKTFKAVTFEGEQKTLRDELLEFWGADEFI